MLNLMNSDRANFAQQYNITILPLALSPGQSSGIGSCVGSYGHSTAMAKSGSIWHENPDYPDASFPNNICVAWNYVGENVGEWSTGNELTDLTNLEQAMYSEPKAPGCIGNHACNIVSTQFTRVGIGIFVSGGTTWLTEDFIG